MITCTGTIKASDINTELNRGPTSLFKIGNTEERSLAGVPSGLIKFSDFYCKSRSFNMAIGYGELFLASRVGFYSFNSSVNNGVFGAINGSNPSQLFPAGYGGSTSAFYVNSCIVQKFFDGSNPTFQMAVSNRPRISSVGEASLYFGSSVIVKFKFSNGVEYEFTAYPNGSVYRSENAGYLDSLLRANLGRACEVTLRRP